MQLTKINKKFQKRLEEILNTYPLIKDIAITLQQLGGISYLVGGAVRDLFLELPIKDIDIEVHGVTLEQLEQVLQKFGPVSLVGKSFGVLKLAHVDVDWSVPRRDSSGRKPVVELAPVMTLQEAFKRRDLTINAMGINVLTFELVDPFNGLADLNAKILRTPDAQLFIQDPLRFFRVMQFVARFNMDPDQQLNDICSTMNISEVSQERKEQEFKKWLLLSQKPSRALNWLDHIQRLFEVLPEVAATKGIAQEYSWHPEGDVFEHTKQTIDAAAVLDYANQQEKLIVLYAALGHDLGKVVTTQIIDGLIRSHGHAQAGAAIVKKMMQRITRDKELIDKVSTLVNYHMQPVLLVTSKAKLTAYKRLAYNLGVVTLNMLAHLALADQRGRNPQKGQPLTQTSPLIEEFIKHAHQAEVFFEREEPILKGRDLLDVIPAGPLLGVLVKKAYQLQLDEGIVDKQQLKQMVLAMLNQEQK